MTLPARRPSFSCHARARRKAPFRRRRPARAQPREGCACGRTQLPAPCCSRSCRRSGPSPKFLTHPMHAPHSPSSKRTGRAGAAQAARLQEQEKSEPPPPNFPRCSSAEDSSGSDESAVRGCQAPLAPPHNARGRVSRGWVRLRRQAGRGWSVPSVTLKESANSMAELGSVARGAARRGARRRRGASRPLPKRGGRQARLSAILAHRAAEGAGAHHCKE